eukprot:gene12823-biopygen5098
MVGRVPGSRCWTGIPCADEACPRPPCNLQSHSALEFSGLWMQSAVSVARFTASLRKTEPLSLRQSVESTLRGKAAEQSCAAKLYCKLHGKVVLEGGAAKLCGKSCSKVARQSCSASSAEGLGSKAEQPSCAAALRGKVVQQGCAASSGAEWRRSRDTLITGPVAEKSLGQSNARDWW